MNATKLRALEYPAWRKPLDVNDDTAFRTLIVWLEEMKIRALDVEQRGALRDIASADWPQALRAYLEVLECPARLFAANASENEGGRQAVVAWLLSQAVSAEFHDNAAQFNQAAPVALTIDDDDNDGDNEDNAMDLDQPQHSGETKTDESLDDYMTPEFEQALRTLAETVGVPTDGGQDSVSLLRMVRHRIVTSFSPAQVSALKAANESGGEAKADYEQSLDAALKVYDLGFSTGDTRVDRAAMVLRLLYIADLRDVQTMVNELIVFVQEYTANPRTDSRLGKVGR
eukprot:TRINITY_DN7562_c0_g1_i2.p1 TRINITY_DN7562_c0_g1~~TRINITY_DN7562_c0_g1_i2.p1  ORF type:complete len:286 (-),score=136.54 TRINITY_DN7562_c0_g1_i2:33-890(-)